jgi:hypothetical protein
MVGQMQVYDNTTNAFGPTQQVCGIDPTKLAAAQFKVCPAGTNGTGALNLFIGQPQLMMDVVIYNFAIH